MADPGDNEKCGRDPSTVNAPGSFAPYGQTFRDDPFGISPRLGFVYKVGGGTRDVIRGSWGLFRDQANFLNAEFLWGNDCPNCFPSLPFLSGSSLQAGTIVLPNAPPLPVDFTLSNWVNDPGLRAWLDDLTSALGPIDFNQTFSPA